MNLTKKVILLGGSFDPIHYGHLKIVLHAIKQSQADEGWFILAKQAPLKSETQLSFNKRAEMVKMMIKSYSHLKLCSIENELPAPNYTINTVTRLKELYPENEFVFLIGSDQAENFDQWHSYQALLEMIEIMVYPREADDIIDQSIFTKLEAPILDISSTNIRKGLSTATHPQILSTMIQKGYYSLEMIKQELDEDRIKHSLSVAKLAKELALIHGVDDEKAYALGLIHDYFKHKTSSSLRPYLSEDERQQPDYLHHAYGLAHYISKVYYVRDREFLKAIYHHVTGNSGHKLAQILFIADKSEPLRHYPTEIYRKMAKTSLNHAVARIKKDIEEFERMNK